MRALRSRQLTLLAAAMTALTVGCVTQPADMLSDNSDGVSRVREADSAAGTSAPDAPAASDDAAAATDDGSASTPNTHTVTSSNDTQAGPPAPTDTGTQTGGSNDAAEDDDGTNDIPSASDIPGDMNGDGKLDADDIVPLLTYYGLEVEGGEDGDLNGDGIVSITDLGILLSMLGG